MEPYVDYAAGNYLQANADDEFGQRFNGGVAGYVQDNSPEGGDGSQQSAGPTSTGQGGGGNSMTSFEAEARGHSAGAPSEYQQTPSESESRQAAQNIAQGKAAADGVHLLGGTWNIEGKKLPDWASTTLSTLAGGLAGGLFARKADTNSPGASSNTYLDYGRKGLATAVGIAVAKGTEPWISENIKYPSVSYTPDPLTPEQQAQAQRNETQKQHILNAMGRGGVYDPTYAKDDPNAPLNRH